MHLAGPPSPSPDSRRLQSNDYSEIEDQHHMVSPRRRPDYRHRLGAESKETPRILGRRGSKRSSDFNYGASDGGARSDPSEISDTSDLSRVSLRGEHQPSNHHHHHRYSTSRSNLDSEVRTRYRGGTVSVASGHPASPFVSPKCSPRLEAGLTDRGDAALREGTSSFRRNSRTPYPGYDREKIGGTSTALPQAGGRAKASEAGGQPTQGESLASQFDANAPGPTSMAGAVERTGVRKARASIGHKFSNVLGRGSKSSSTCNLDKKSRTSFQRSEEVLPGDESFAFGPAGRTSNSSSVQRRILHHQTSLSSGQSEHAGGTVSIYSGEGTDFESGVSQSLTRNESHVGEFVEGLGPGQLVGRQVLGMPCLGEIQLSFYDRRGHLEVEVIRARGLQHKNAGKPPPAPYVKLHLLEGKQSVEKTRTATSARRTLDPLYQQQLSFSVPYQGKLMQVSVWGEYGRMEKKVFLGMSEIVLDDLDLSSVVFGWYKLFGMIASNAHQHERQQRQIRHQGKPMKGASGQTEDRSYPPDQSLFESSRSDSAGEGSSRQRTKRSAHSVKSPAHSLRSKSTTRDKPILNGKTSTNRSTSNV